MQVLLLAQAYGVMKLGNSSLDGLDGTKLHAAASKSKAVSYVSYMSYMSYQRAGELEGRLRREVQELMALAERADREGREWPPNLNVATEMAFRQERLAKQVLEARARERFQAEQAAYEATLRERERDEAAQRKGKPPRGRGPRPPTAGRRDTDHATRNFAAPESRNMKNRDDGGFDQHYNAQVVVDQGRRVSGARCVRRSISSAISSASACIRLWWADPSRMAVLRRVTER